MSKSGKYNTPYDRDMANIARKRAEQPVNHSRPLMGLIMIPFIAAGFATAVPMGIAMVVTTIVVLSSTK